MKKHLLLNVAGVAVLSLMCACGPQKEESKEETKKEALAEVPESVKVAADEALAQAEPAPETVVPGEESAPVEEESTTMETAAADAAPAPAAEPAKA